MLTILPCRFAVCGDPAFCFGFARLGWGDASGWPAARWRAGVCGGNAAVVLLLGYLVVNDRAAGEGYVGGGDWGRMGVRGNLQASRSVAAVGRGWGGGIRPRGGD